MEPVWTVGVGHGCFGRRGGTSWREGIGGHGRARKDVVLGADEEDCPVLGIPFKKTLRGIAEHWALNCIFFFLSLRN